MNNCPQHRRGSSAPAKISGPQIPHQAMNHYAQRRPALLHPPAKISVKTLWFSFVPFVPFVPFVFKGLDLLLICATDNEPLASQKRLKTSHFKT
jgi:hypothetical protein